jgi:hypothetical protein
MAAVPSHASYCSTRVITFCFFFFPSYLVLLFWRVYGLKFVDLFDKKEKKEKKKREKERVGLCFDLNINEVN